MMPKREEKLQESSPLEVMRGQYPEGWGLGAFTTGAGGKKDVCEDR